MNKNIGLIIGGIIIFGLIGYLVWALLKKKEEEEPPPEPKPTPGPKPPPGVDYIRSGQNALMSAEWRNDAGVAVKPEWRWDLKPSGLRTWVEGGARGANDWQANKDYVGAYEVVSSLIWAYPPSQWGRIKMEPTDMKLMVRIDTQVREVWQGADAIYIVPQEG